jgi:SOS-response transcriptional repressor LexA
MPDDSMINRQLNAGDYLIIRKQDTANNGEVALVRHGLETFIRTYYKGLRQVRLQAESESHETIVTNDDELIICGVVIGFLHFY